MKMRDAGSNLRFDRAVPTCFRSLITVLRGGLFFFVVLTAGPCETRHRKLMRRFFLRSEVRINAGTGNSIAFLENWLGAATETKIGKPLAAVFLSGVKLFESECQRSERLARSFRSRYFYHRP
jgi:hypothetical protein